MFSARQLLVVPALLVCGYALAEVGVEEAESDADFDLAGYDAALHQGGADLGLDDADFVGNPLKKLAKNWPEDLVVAPIPGRSPQLGWKLTMAGGYFLNSRDEDSEAAPSVLGGFAMVAENGSSAFGAGANLHLLDDRLRIKAGGGYADVRYRFYGIGNDNGNRDIGVDLLQKGPLYAATGSWRIWRKFYVGAGYLSGSVDTRLRVALPDPLPFFDPSLKVDIAGYVIPVEIDSRDHEQFPRSGWLINARGILYRESAGSDFDAQTFKLSVNHYWPMGEQNVLASRLVTSTTSGNAPFFLLSTFGGSTDLRGYPSGRYRDRMMYALQSEYRWQVNDHWIATGFAGFGEVAADVSDFGENFLPAAGVGLRYVLSQKHRVGLSFDVAVGDDGAEFYFGVGEAF